MNSVGWVLVVFFGSLTMVCLAGASGAEQETVTLEGTVIERSWDEEGFVTAIDLETEASEAEAGSEQLEKAGERQEALKDAVDGLAEDAASIAPRVSDEHPAAGEKVSEASEKLSSGEIQEAMEKAAETMSGGDGSAAQPSQEEARQGVLRLSLPAVRPPVECHR